MAAKHGELGLEVRGLGLIQGLVGADPALASSLSRLAFERGLLIETAGPNDEVLKFLPPLSIDDTLLAEGLDIVEACLAEVSRRPTCKELTTEAYS